MSETPEGYADSDLAYWLWRALQGGQKTVESLAHWMGDQGVDRVLGAFSGPAIKELGLLSSSGGRPASVVLTDGSEPLLGYARTEADRLGLADRVAGVISAEAPWDGPACRALADLGPYDAVTCLGVSVFHIAAARGRRQFFRDCFSMTRPGGWLVVDNKKWSADLREERAPISLYASTGPDDDRPHRILAVTHSYPRAGEQVYHLCLFDSCTCELLGRWELYGFPVHTEQLVEDVRSAGYVISQADDLPQSPRPDIDLIFGQRPEEAPRHGRGQ